ncbi:hypothetical protein CRYUN_Cryun36dG0104400 [Craigia yunnanensis]
MIFVALVLLLATLEADGQRLTLEKEREHILCGHASTHKLCRKADVGANDDKDSTANKGAVTGRTAVDDSAVDLVDSQEEELNDNQIHRYFINGTNPYVRPGPVPPKDYKQRKP